MKSNKAALLKVNLFLLFSLFMFLIGEVSASWDISTIAIPNNTGIYDTKGKYSSLCLDSNGKVYISYMKQTQTDPDGYTYNLNYITNSDGDWREEPLGLTYPIWAINNSGNFASLTLDKNNKIYLSFMENDVTPPTSGFSVIVATNITGSWARRGVDWGGPDYLRHNWTKIKTDLNGAVHMAYLLQQKDSFGTLINSDLKYTTNSSGAYISEVIDPADKVGSDLSLAIDSNQHLHVSYYDAVNLALKYATNASGAWATSIIDNSSSVGLYTSIGVDLNNRIHISYYDSTNRDLKYATNISGSWNLFTIDSTGNVGQYSSLAVDSDNKIHISYYDSTNGNLKYATNSRGAWISSTIDNAGDVGKYSSLAIDAEGTVHISYYDITDRSLKYAVGSGIPGNQIFLPLLIKSQN